MRISTKGRYATRLMLDLALNGGEGAVSLKKIAERQDISDKYMEQIITRLMKAGYVKSIRGAQGGYQLTKPPEAYTVGMILEVMEGSLAPVACLACGENPCTRAEECVTLEIWAKLKDAIDGVVEGITLADLVARHQEKNGADSGLPVLC